LDERGTKECADPPTHEDHRTPRVQKKSLFLINMDTLEHEDVLMLHG